MQNVTRNSVLGNKKFLSKRKRAAQINNIAICFLTFFRARRQIRKTSNKKERKEEVF
jgi:hypothetical protein